jgi:alkanesulfonate monooxygenase SsuD/methylene tetrahydromethanopterin reductase-like flavin-dependent oxidoreductase (luciferase family)
VKKIGFLSFGHWSASPYSQVRTGSDALIQSIELAEAVEDLGADGAYFRVHHFAQQLASPFPLLAAIGARTKRIEIGTAVIDMRYENPLYMVEDAGAADLIAGGRQQLGISRGSPEQVIDGFRYFGYAPREGTTDADMAREHTGVFLEALSGVGFAEPNPTPMFPNPPGLLRPEPHSPGLRERVWWGAGTRATAEWTAQQGMNLMSSTLLTEDAGMPFHELNEQIGCSVRRGLRLGTSASAGVGQSQHLRAGRRPRPCVLRARQPSVGSGRLYRRADQGDLRAFVRRGARRPRQGARR